MANDFSFSHDLYYWGQDRLGSIVPLLASLLVKLGVPAVYAIACTQYFLLLAGYYCFAFFMRRPLVKSVFAAAWFLPLVVFHTHLQIGHPYTGQIFFLGLSLYCFHRSRAARTKFGSAGLLFLSSLSFILSAWVNDLSLLLLPVYILYLLLSLQEIDRTQNRLVLTFSLRFGYRSLSLLLGFMFGFVFLLIAKKTAGNTAPQYDLVFSGVSKIAEGFNVVARAFSHTLLFKVHNVLMSFHVLLACLLLLVLLGSVFARHYGRSEDFLLRSFLFFSAIFSFVLVVASHWVEMAQYRSRYFTFSYYVALLFVFVSVDRLKKHNFYVAAVSITIPMVMLSAADGIVVSHRVILNENYISVPRIRKVIHGLGDCGIIGDYWMSYSLASMDPGNIIASARDDGPVRNTRLVHALMKSKRFILCPITGWQFFPGDYPVRLFPQKPGELFVREGLSMCEYRVVKTIDYPASGVGYRFMQENKADPFLLVKRIPQRT